MSTASVHVPAEACSPLLVRNPMPDDSKQHNQYNNIIATEIKVEVNARATKTVHAFQAVE